MRFSRKGQSVVEYVTIAILIMAGIVIGGPFLLNSFRAHFKMYDDSVQDSFSENIRQDPTAPAGACSCEAWSPRGCGEGGCSAYQRFYIRSCSGGLGCSTNKCENEDNCCTAPMPDRCGQVPIVSGDIDDQCPSRGGVSAQFAGYTGTCVKAGVDSNDCAIGERLYKVTCGSAGLNPRIINMCHEEHPVCDATCWDFFSSDPQGRPIATSTDCNAGNEEGPQSALGKELVIRKGLSQEYPYNGGDTPLRPFCPGSPDAARLGCNASNGAYQVQYFYFDPKYAQNPPDLAAWVAAGCATGGTHAGEVQCQRCGFNGKRRCEKVCPDGMVPAAVNGIKNATCKACSPGTVQIAVSKYANGVVVDTYLYQLPYVLPGPTKFTVQATYKDLIFDSFNVSGGISRVVQYADWANDQQACMTDLSLVPSGPCTASCPWPKTGGHDQQKSILINVPDSQSVCANFNHYNPKSINNVTYTTGMGNYFALVFLRDDKATSSAKISYTSPDFNICSSETIRINVGSLGGRTSVYSSDGISRLVFLAFADNNTTDYLEIPKEDAGISYLWVETTSSPSICDDHGNCFQRDHENIWKLTY